MWQVLKLAYDTHPPAPQPMPSTDYANMTASLLLYAKPAITSSLVKALQLPVLIMPKDGQAQADMVATIHD